MGWASHAIDALRRGETVQLRPRGHSMKPKVESGALCTIAPIASDERLDVGAVVLCRVRGREYLHLVCAIRGDRYLIGNNRGGQNGWVGRTAIFGRLIATS